MAYSTAIIRYSFMWFIFPCLICLCHPRTLALLLFFIKSKYQYTLLFVLSLHSAHSILAYVANFHSIFIPCHIFLIGRKTACYNSESSTWSPFLLVVFFLWISHFYSQWTFLVCSDTLSHTHTRLLTFF